jgi:hypothetical protein
MIVQETKREKTFRQIFQELEFPFLSLDECKIEDALKKGKDISSYIGLVIDEEDPKHDAVRGAFRGIIGTIEPPQWVLDQLKDSELLQGKFNLTKTIKEQLEAPQNSFVIYTKDGNLIWEEQSYWPLAYSTFFQQIQNITHLYRIALSKREEELDKITKGRIQLEISPEFPRHMPTIIHYAFASLGAWIGGAASVQFFSLYATAPQIKNDDTNIRYGVSVGYTNEEAKSLTESGIIVVPSSLALPLLEAQTSNTIFGSLPLEEFNLANPPLKETFIEDLKAHHEKTKLSGLIIDKYYRTPFFARKLNPSALLGSKDVLRDHYTEFYKSQKHESLIRCKHYCAPIIEVNNIEEIEKIVSVIPIRGQGGLFFRGQTSFYDLKRTSDVKTLLFGNSTSVEPSLLSAASRSNFNYEKLHFALKYFLGQEMLFKTKSSKELFDRWSELSVSPICKYDLAIMALAQHYGFPTNGLDVTTNIQVAAWFATNKYSDQNGISTYTKLSKNDWIKDKAKWPIIYVFQTILNSSYGSLQNCNEVNELGLIALRPERQNAKFFLGGHSDHQNRLAESVVCALRLKPGEYDVSVDFDYLFPTPDMDPAYKYLLELTKNSRFVTLTNGKINCFHY